MAIEEASHDEVDPVPLRIVIRLVHLFEDHGFFLVQVGLGEGEVKKDFLLVPKGEIGLARGKGDLEEGQVLAGVGVEVGAVSADIAADLVPGPGPRAPEKEAVLEEVGDPVARVGLILGPRVDGHDDVDEGKVVLLIEKNIEPVGQNERPTGVALLGGLGKQDWG
jgi:hypothetical protein